MKTINNKTAEQRSNGKLISLSLLLISFLLFLNAGFAQGLLRPSGFTNEIPKFKIYGKAASQADSAAVMNLMGKFGRARGAGDAKTVASCFSTDAEWTNAFGVVVRGREKLHEFLGWLFSEDMEGTTEGESIKAKLVSLRYIGDNAVVIHGVTESTRGESRVGKGTRKVHVTFVLSKNSGEWLIAHQMIMDARDLE
jgi:uncharacterized protein (TIGR02246 family)